MISKIKSLHKMFVIIPQHSLQSHNEKEVPYFGQKAPNKDKNDNCSITFMSFFRSYELPSANKFFVV